MVSGPWAFFSVRRVRQKGPVSDGNAFPSSCLELISLPWPSFTGMLNYFLKIDDLNLSPLVAHHLLVNSDLILACN